MRITTLCIFQIVFITSSIKRYHKTNKLQNQNQIIYYFSADIFHFIIFLIYCNVLAVILNLIINNSFQFASQFHETKNTKKN